MGLWDDYNAEMQFYHDFPYDVPSDVWRTKDGTEIKLCDMSESHIRNCMRMVGDEDDWYARFEQELNRRKSMSDDFDYYAAMSSLYPDTEYIINKSAYDSGVEGVKEEIVRCRDCEYFYANDYGDQCCSNNYAGLWDGTPDSFCSWGKRKTN